MGEGRWCNGLPPREPVLQQTFTCGRYCACARGRRGRTPHHVVQCAGTIGHLVVVAHCGRVRILIPASIFVYIC